MRRIHFILFLVISIKCNGQVDLENLSNAKNYLNAKISFLAIHEKANQNNALVSRYDLIKDKFATINITNSFTYEELYHLLQPTFPRTIQILSQPIEDIEINAFMNLDAKEASKKMVDTIYEILKGSYPKEYKSIIREKKNLTSEVESFFKSETIAPTSSSIISKDSVELNPRNESELNTTVGFFNIRSINLYTLILLILLVFQYIFFSKKIFKINQRLERHRNDINDLSTKRLYENNIKSSSSTQIISVELKEKLIEFENKLSQIESNSKNQPPSNFLTDDQDVGYVQQETFYMSGPVSNYFPNAVKSKTKENTVYKFTLNTNKREASYEIHTTGAPIQEIVNMAESYIKPACDEENFPSLNVHKIITKLPGVAILQGEKWVIKSKALIRYE